MTCEIWNGDSRELVTKLPDNINLVVTDPPFGVEFRSRTPVTPQGKKWARDIQGDADLPAALELFWQVFVPLSEKCAEESQAFVFTRWDVVDAWITLARELEEPTGFVYSAMQVWDRGYPGKGSIDDTPGMGFELLLFLRRGRRDINFRRSGVFAIDKPHPGKHSHPTEKPVGLAEQFITMFTDPGDLVVDPFAGTGSTILAAQRTNRRGIGIEMDAQHAQMARERLAQGAPLPLLT